MPEYIERKTVLIIMLWWEYLIIGFLFGEIVGEVIAKLGRNKL